MVSHDQRPLAALSEPHTEPQIRRLYGHRPIEKRHTGSSPRTPIGRAPYRDVLNLLRSHVDPPFVRVYTEINFRDGGRSAGTSAPSRPMHSTIHRLCEILDMRFQSRRCGYCCTIANANFLRKHYAIVASSGTQLYIYPLVYPGSLVFQLSSILYRLSYLKRPHRLSKQSFVLTRPTAFLQLPYQLLAKQYNISS